MKLDYGKDATKLLYKPYYEPSVIKPYELNLTMTQCYYCLNNPL